MVRFFPLLIVSVTLLSQGPTSIFKRDTSVQQIRNSDLFKARRAVLEAKDQVIGKSGTPAPGAEQQVLDAQNAAAQIERSAPAPVALPASPDDVSRLSKVVTDLMNSAKDDAGAAGIWATIFGVGTLLSGAAAAGLSGFQMNKQAAIASALVVLFSGMPKFLSFPNQAIYNRTIANTSYRLLNNMTLDSNMTTIEYESYRRQFEILADYKANVYPSSGDVALTTDSLMKDLAAAVVTK